MPAGYLSRDIAAALAERSQHGRRDIDAVNLGQDLDHRQVDSTAVDWLDTRQKAIGENAPLDMVHDIERLPDQAVFHAEQVHPRQRDALASERGLDVNSRSMAWAPGSSGPDGCLRRT